MRCSNDVLLNKIGVDKLNKRSELAFTVMSNLPDCRKIDTKKYIDFKATGGGDAAITYNRFRVPENVFECMRTGCINSGTAYSDKAGEFIYKAQFDAVEFASGVITFYVIDAANTVTVKISDTSEFTNADQYNVTVGREGADGFRPVIVDLSQVPDTTIGNGWTANRDSAYISINLGQANAGVSSIGIFDSMNDFETSDVVAVGCLTEVSTDYEISAAEATCWSSGYDTSDLSFERTITGNSVTPNYWKLNPLMGKGSATVGFERVTTTKTIERSGNYGTISLPDLDQNECGFLSVAFADNCNVTDAMLTRLTIPAMIDVDEGHYFVISETDGSTTVYFNKELVGSEVIVSYPRIADVEEEIADVENVGNVRVRMTETIEQTDGTKLVFVYDNVLVTTFPATINEEETEFSFTVNIQKDASGHYFRKYRILS